LILQLTNALEDPVIAKTKIVAARTEISNPLNGKNKRKLELIPIKGKTPIPQTTHPGTTIPKKAPTLAKNPAFLKFPLDLANLNL